VAVEPAKATIVDVAVLGAGPAGCAAALTLARERRSVALVDRLPAMPAGRVAAASPPPYPRQAGETLLPAARAPLAALGLWERFAGGGHRPSPGVVSAWGGPEPVETDFLFHPHGCGWHLDRPAFDRMLRDAAAEAGAHLLTGTRLLHGERRPRDGGWELVLGSNDETAPARVCLRARLVIVATGRALPSELPLPPIVRERVALDRLVAIAARLPSLRAADEDGDDPRLLLEAMPGGWWYVAPVPGNTRMAVFLTDSDLVRAAGGASTLWRQALADAPLARRHAAADGSVAVGSVAAPVAAQSYCRRAVAGPDFLLAGDAASACDPLTGQGLRRALEEGRAAALAAAARLETRDAEPMRAYASRVRASWGAYVRRRTEIYGAERRWEREPFWRRRQFDQRLSGGSPT
jgi:flavin-dependent dehydrogenase